MKKILIPTLLTLTTTPFISMVSCKQNEPEPEDDGVYLDTYVGEKGLRSEQLTDIHNGDVIKFIVDISKYEETRFQGHGFIELWSDLSLTKQLSINPLLAQDFIADGIELQPTKEYGQDNAYTIQQYGELTTIYWKCSKVATTKHDTTFEFTLEFGQDVPQLVVSWFDDPS